MGRCAGGFDGLKDVGHNLTGGKRAKARLSTKGQIVLPKEIRDQLGLTPGAELDVEVKDGAIILRARHATTTADLLGLLRWDGAAKSLDEMEAAIALGAREQR